ncbi:MAG: LysR family transcriptional regulator, partial [Gemmatimonadetes bacterium]|nr:LysR family transcriptional regulator [Gemmatimonadota bacterium]
LQIKALENELDEILLERNRRQLRLTPAGEILFAHAKAVLARLEKARDDIAALKQVLRGRLAIGTSDTNCTYILPNVLAEFRARYPEVELDIRNRMSPEVSNLVLNDEVDFGLATLPVKHRDLVCESLFERRDVLICPPDHALGKRRRIGLKQLAEYPFLVLERGSTSRQLLDEVFQRQGLALQVEMTLGGIEIIKRYVEIGLGIALVPEVAVEAEVAAGKVRAIQVNGLAKRQIGLIEHRQRRRSPATEAFLALLREFVSAGKI